MRLAILKPIRSNVLLRTKHDVIVSHYTSNTTKYRNLARAKSNRKILRFANVGIPRSHIENKWTELSVPWINAVEDLLKDAQRFVID
jgi:hypothetical protein